MEAGGMNASWSALPGIHAVAHSPPPTIGSGDLCWAEADAALALATLSAGTSADTVHGALQTAGLCDAVCELLNKR